MRKVIPRDAVLIPDTAARVFQGEIFDVYHWPQKLFDGSMATFEMLRRPDTVSAICVVGDNILVLQDEQPHRGTRLSFPGGRIDEGEDLLAAIQREVREETGYEFEQWRLVNVWQPFVKMEWFVHMYLAWGDTRTGQRHLDPGERIVVEQVPFAKVRHLALHGAGHIKESRDLFEAAATLQELLDHAVFAGQEVDR